MVATSIFGPFCVATPRILLPGPKKWVCWGDRVWLGCVRRIFAPDLISTPILVFFYREAEIFGQNQKLENEISVGIFTRAFCRRYKVDWLFFFILKVVFQILSRNWILVFFILPILRSGIYWILLKTIQCHEILLCIVIINQESAPEVKGTMRCTKISQGQAKKVKLLSSANYHWTINSLSQRFVHLCKFFYELVDLFEFPGFFLH